VIGAPDSFSDCAKSLVKRTRWWLLILPFLGLAYTEPGYAPHLLVMFGIYLLLTYSLNLIMGFGGLITFCHATSYGIGAYVYSLTRLRFSPQESARGMQFLWTGDWGFVAGTLAACTAGALLAWCIAFVCLRFRRDQFIFATLGCQMLFFAVLYNITSLAGGQTGIHGIARPMLFGRIVDTSWGYVALVWGFVAIVLALLFRIYRAPLGLSLKAAQQDERAARSAGIHTELLFLRALVLAGCIAGLAGSLYAGYVTYVDPTSFSLRESIYLVTILLLGGAGNRLGPLVGTAIALGLPEALRLLEMPSALAANLREILYGALLIALVYWRPNGLAGSKAVKF
jgi:branched-chain amino acid transport system permease protein